jgi:eukaryotic-like serine/threonine-protein kinase
MKQGDLVQDRYLLEERLGKGGMGQVWRAHDQRLDRTVGIKVMAPELTEQPEFLVRFLREAQSIARISHPNVVSVLDFGESEDIPFLVMEYVPGRPLSELTGAPMDPDRARAIVAQAADASGAAHVQGVIHRDLKPANILLTDDGRVKLVDFGIASLKNVDRITQTGTTIGSPHYISPEQATGDKASPRSDVYALGAVLFELLTGERPFEGESVAAVAMAHVDEAARPPSELVPGLDPQLDAIVLKALAKNPNERYADGRELSQALSPDTNARTAVVPAAVAADVGGKTLVMAPDRTVLPYDSDDDNESPWRAALIGLLIGFVILAIALAAYALLSGDDTPSSSGAPDGDGGNTNQPAQESTTESAPVEEPVEEPVDDTGESEPIPPESDTEGSPPAEEDEDDSDEEEEPSDEETVEGDVDVEGGQGPDGEGPPGQIKKEEEE